MVRYKSRRWDAGRESVPGSEVCGESEPEPRADVEERVKGYARCDRGCGGGERVREGATSVCAMASARLGEERGEGRGGGMGKASVRYVSLQHAAQRGDVSNGECCVSININTWRAARTGIDDRSVKTLGWENQPNHGREKKTSETGERGKRIRIKTIEADNSPAIFFWTASARIPSSMTSRTAPSAVQLRLRAAVNEFAEGAVLLGPPGSQKLVLNTIAAACTRRIEWRMLFAFLKTFVNDKPGLVSLTRKFAQSVRDERVAMRLAHRELATGTGRACTVCFSFKATEPCLLCGVESATCCGCEGLCWTCEEE